MADTKSREMFVNLPVQNLAKSVDFFTKLGFEFDPRFTDENATCMIVGEKAFVMLLVQDFFKSFITKDLADSTTHVEATTAISAESREQVDEVVDHAMAAGAQPSGFSMDEGYMYGRSFQDLDGHLWEVLYMDMSAMAP
jgi:uncharacterized protein